MSSCAITVTGLGKSYLIAHRANGARGRYKTLREEIVDLPRRIAARFSGNGAAQAEIFWALRNISFDVKRGEVIGVIGRNGAGKSTLLKILSRITEPTTGQAEIFGRVGSLLEVGTGFHQELTGRENIFLNGAVLGMSRSEIQRKFDEIVAFAEIDKFLDTPVKRYSSGMYVRLAFAVAAHLDPEILLVDEVLAVGDSEFQKKCLGKMGEVARGGRTVLFVSHNIPAVRNLCSRSLLLERGEITAIGETGDVLDRYAASMITTGGERIWNASDPPPGDETMRFQAVRLLTGEECRGEVDIDKDLRIQLEYVNRREGAKLSTSIHLLDQTGAVILASINAPSATIGTDPWFGRGHPIGLYRTECIIPANFLNEGRYMISAFLMLNVTEIKVTATEVLSFTVRDLGSMRDEYAGPWIGMIRPKLQWATTLVSETAPQRPN